MSNKWVCVSCSITINNDDYSRSWIIGIRDKVQHITLEMCVKFTANFNSLHLGNWGLNSMAKHLHDCVCNGMQGTVSSCLCSLVAHCNLHVCCNLLMSQFVAGCVRLCKCVGPLAFIFSFFLFWQELGDPGPHYTYWGPWKTEDFT